MKERELFDVLVNTTSHMEGWDEIQNKRSRRSQLHAFLLLDELFPTSTGNDVDLICSAEHDQIWFDVTEEDMAGNITDDQIRELVACGVFFDSEVGTLSMYA